MDSKELCLFIIEFVIFIVSVAGNSMVLFVMLKGSYLKEKTCNIYLISITVVDLLSSFCSMPSMMVFVSNSAISKQLRYSTKFFFSYAAKFLRIILIYVA